MVIVCCLSAWNNGFEKYVVLLFYEGHQVRVAALALRFRLTPLCVKRAPTLRCGERTSTLKPVLQLT